MEPGKLRIRHLTTIIKHNQLTFLHLHLISRWGKTALNSAEEGSHASAAKMIDQFEQQQNMVSYETVSVI